MIGKMIGPYKVVAKVGEGGMGEVYRARDTRLDRDVAIKVLPESFADNSDRLARFAREAKTLAALNHPNIAHIHGLEESPSRSTSSGQAGSEQVAIRALVMEFVDGEDLAERITRGPIPVDEAIAIARQIADALESAHDQGIIHRDLKPANVKVRNDGTVKVLDFGLAKAANDAGSGIGGATMTSPAMTAAGIILGTAAYMSPEQARGRGVDKRADIWAFGVVLYEMLTGRFLFATDTMSDTIAAVLTREIDLSQLPSGVPVSTTALIRRCLEREPKRRLRDIGDARIELESPADSSSSTPRTAGTQTHPPARTRDRWLVFITIALALALVAALVTLWRTGPARALVQASIQFDISPPAGTRLLLLSSGSAVAVSPDGSIIAMVAVRNGISHVYVRRRDDVEVREIPGTEGASDTALSPDAKWLAVWTDDTLRKISIDGATSVTLASGRSPRGLVWLDNDTIVTAQKVNAGLGIVPAGGGAPRGLTALDVASGERTHRWPAVVRGGKAVLFTIGTRNSPDDYNDSQIDAVVVATGVRKKVLDGASFVRCTSDGRLIYARSGVLYTIGFDPERLQTIGAPSTVLPGVEGDGTTGAAHFSIAHDATLVYVPGPGATNQRRLVWMDRAGVAAPLDVAPGYYNDPDVSHDGRRVAVVVGASGHGDVWTYDSDRKIFTRLTFDGHAATPHWSADDRAVYYTSIDPASDKTAIVRIAVDAGGAPTIVGSVPGRAYLGYIAPSGAFAIITQLTSPFGDIMKMPISPPGPLETIVANPAQEMSPAVSPDSRWLAYIAADPGAPDVYVRELNGPGKWQISTGGGTDPHWSPDGRELFYRSDTRQMAVPIDVSSRFRPGAAHVLFEGAYNWHTESGMNSGVDPKTGRLLMLRPPTSASAPVVRVVTNWLQHP